MQPHSRGIWKAFLLPVGTGGGENASENGLKWVGKALDPLYSHFETESTNENVKAASCPHRENEANNGKHVLIPGCAERDGKDEE